MMCFTRGARIAIMTAVLPLAGCVSVLKSGPPDNLYRFGIVEDPAHEAPIIERDKKPVTLGRVRFAPEIDGVHRTAARIPAARPLAGDERMQADRLGNRRALLFRLHVLVLDPFQAVRRDFPARILHRGDLFRAAR